MLLLKFVFDDDDDDRGVGVDSWRCIVLAAAAANSAAKTFPPSSGSDGDGGTAVGEAVIVSGARLVGTWWVVPFKTIWDLCSLEIVAIIELN